MDSLKNRIIVFLLAFTVWGCSDKDEPMTENASSVSLSTDIIQMDRNGGDVPVTITSSDNWRLAGVYDWVHPSATEGESGEIVTFTIDPNQMNEKRVAVFKFFVGASVASLQVETEFGYSIALLSETEISMPKEENEVKIQFATNVIDPVISCSEGSEEWLTLNKSIDFAGILTLSFSAIENEMYKDRSAAITVSSPLVAEPVEVQIFQARTEAIIPESDLLLYDFSENTVSFSVKYNVEYEASVTKGSEWIAIQSASEPIVGDDGLSTVMLNCRLNEASETRGGMIRIAKVDGKLGSDISIVQKDPGVDLIAIPDNTLRTVCINNGWVFSVIGNQCIVLEAGLKATFLATSYYDKVDDLTGIEYFPNLTSINIQYCGDMKKVDISGLYKVSSLSLSEAYSCGEYILGDNPILSFNVNGYEYSESENLVLSGSKIQSMDLSLISSYVRYDKVKAIDVSGCPALITLNADRSSNITTLYLKEGQVIQNLKKNNATTIVYK